MRKIVYQESFIKIPKLYLKIIQRMKNYNYDNHVSRITRLRSFYFILIKKII